MPKKFTFAGNSDLFALRLKIYGFCQKKAVFFYLDLKYTTILTFYFSAHGAASSVSTEETTSKDPNLLVNYSDSSNDNDHDDNDKDPPLFDMEVDEDGAPKLNEEVVSASSNSNFTEKTTSNVSSGNKRPAVTETEIGENDNSGVQEAKKAKLMEEQKTSTTDA